MNKDLQNRCQARTNAGNRCKRKKNNGSAFCKQHEKKLKGALWSYRSGKLNMIPDPPKTLSESAAGFWNQYCRFLLDEEMLLGIYLWDINELCWRIDFRIELEEYIDKHGILNKYKNGFQLIGIDKILDRNDKRITDLKKQFGLTLDTYQKLHKKKNKKEGETNGDNVYPINQKRKKNF